MIWPNYFPKQCPPTDARADEIQVFRLVANSPPTVDDFLPTKREFPHRQFANNEVLCIACGVSVFKEYQDILDKRAKYPKALGHKKVAMGTIMPHDGLVKETLEPSHLTWWLQTNEPHKTFSEIEQCH